MTKLHFYSAWYCPFAQRTWTALEYLGIPYEYKETDPYHKSKPWLKLSRGTGQVPVLRVKNKGDEAMSIPGSLRTMEYLDEICPSCSALFPSSPSERAEARFWMDQQGSDIIPHIYKYLGAEQGSEAEAIAKANMLEGIVAFIDGMTNTGPYFFGDEPGIVDFAFAPFALRIEMLLSHYKGFQLPRTDDNWDRYAVWWRAIKYHPSFIATMPDQASYAERLVEFYIPYSKGGGQQNI